MTLYEITNALSNGGLNEVFSKIYANSEMELLRQKARYLNAAEKFSCLCPECEDVHVFSACGRTEIGGNHTDHQHGCVLAAAVTRDILAIAGVNGESVVRVFSEEYDPVGIDLSDLHPNIHERGTSAAIIRGIAAKFIEMGIEIDGFDAFITSDIPVGIGLSSSAAFEVMIAAIFDRFFNNGDLTSVEIAKIGQAAENEYFGKACGLMDQLVCAVGGFSLINFKNFDSPSVQPVEFDFNSSGFSLCIVDTGGDHCSMSEDYSEIPNDMKLVAMELDREFLCEADEDIFYKHLPEIREKCHDRAILRAIHFFDENKRVAFEAEALSNGNLTDFFELVNKSGDSSAMLLQNMHSPKNTENRELMLAVTMSRRYLRGSGAVRVHGGGFAGGIQAFVPTYMLNGYISELEAIFGQGCCTVMGIRPCGVMRII